MLNQFPRKKLRLRRNRRKSLRVKINRMRKKKFLRRKLVILKKIPLLARVKGNRSQSKNLLRLLHQLQLLQKKIVRGRVIKRVVVRKNLRKHHFQ